jgi:chromosome segregation ATPase
MPEMNGATLTLKDPATGQVVEYEIVRSGTMKEFRGLVKAYGERSDEVGILKAERDDLVGTAARAEHERDELALKARQHEEATEAAKACIADLSRQKDTAAATIATLQDALEKASKEHEEARVALGLTDVQKQHRAGLMSKLEEDKSALDSLLSDISGVIDELHEG